MKGFYGMKKYIIASVLSLLFSFAYATDIQNVVTKISEYARKASTKNFKNVDKRNVERDAMQLVLLQWDANISEYKVFFFHPIKGGIFKGEKMSDNSFVEYKGKYSDNILSLELRCFEKYNNDNIKKYEINTQILIQKTPINILGWSAYTSDKDSMPEFICFVRRACILP